MQSKEVSRNQKGPVLVTGLSVPLTGPSVPLWALRSPYGTHLIVQLSVVFHYIGPLGASKNRGLGQT